MGQITYILMFIFLVITLIITFIDDDSKYILPSFGMVMLSLFITLICAIAPPKKNIRTVISNNVVINNVMLKTDKPVKYIIEDKIYPKWSGKLTQSDTILIEILDK